MSINQYDKRSSGPREVPPSVWLEDDSVYMYTRAVDHLFVCILYWIICTVSFVRAETAWHAAAAQDGKTSRFKLSSEPTDTLILIASAPDTDNADPQRLSTTALDARRADAPDADDKAIAGHTLGIFG